MKTPGPVTLEPVIEVSPTKEFSKSDAFTRSGYFSKTDGFTKSNEFTKTNAFDQTNPFTKSDYFTKSSKFTKSDYFTKSSKFTKSNNFAKTSEFSQSDEFTVIDSPSLSPVPVIIDRGNSDQDKKTNTGMIAGIAVGSVEAVAAIAGLIAFFIKKKHNLLPDEDIETFDDSTNSVNNTNPIYDNEAEDDPFKEDFEAPNK